MESEVTFWTVLGEFIKTYGVSLFMVVFNGLIIAIGIEVTIKNALNWLEKQWEGKPKLLTALQIARIILITVASWALVLILTKILVRNLPFPGGQALYPTWVGMMYISQYIFSMIGLKGIINWWKSRKAAKSPEETEESNLIPTSVKGVYRNAAGDLVDKYNKPVRF